MSQYPYIPGQYAPPAPPAAPAPFSVDPVAFARSIAQLSSHIPTPPVAPAAPIYSDIAEVPNIADVELKNFAEFDDKLKVFGANPDLEYRWVNSDETRVARMWRYGYRPVIRADAARSDVAGSTPRLGAGTQKDHSARHAILMARPKLFRQRQDESYRALMMQNRQSLDPKSYSGNEVSDTQSYRGHVVIQGR